MSKIGIYSVGSLPPYVPEILGNPLPHPVIKCFSKQSIPYADYDFLLLFENSSVVLADCRDKKPLMIEANFTSGSVAHRRQFGGGKGQMLAKAVGLQNKGFYPHVLDATAGMGKDAFVLASLGCQVTMYERSPIVFCLLESGLRQAALMAEENEDQELGSIIARMALFYSNSLVQGQQGAAQNVQLSPYDIVYLDPMFPEKNKTAQVKKEMYAFQAIVGGDLDADLLLEMALEKARYRVVVKRPAKSPYLNEKEPSFQLLGKSSRFDIYTIKKIA